MPGPALSVSDLAKQYVRRDKTLFTAVDGISFDVAEGECFGLLGPNGAGKSTTIDCLTGFYKPSRGRVLIEGVDVHEEPKRARMKLGVCPQDDTLDTDFDLFGQLVRHGTYFRLPVSEAEKRARRLLERFGLADKSSDLVESLSGGMRRRLQVARALISEPSVMVLDEPTTGLDPDARRTLWDILLECRANGIAVLLSTHYMDEAERLCDRIAILHKGKILDMAPPADLVRKHVGEAPIDEEIRPGVRWKRAPNLEDVFLRLAGSTLGAAL